MSHLDKETANKLMEGFSKLRDDPDLTPEQRESIDKALGTVAGDQLSDWLPGGWVRKIIMLVIFLAGLYGAWHEQYKWLYIWLILPIFSPRLMGWATYLAGSFSRVLNRK